MLQTVFPKQFDVSGELLDGGRLEEVADCVPEGNRVPVFRRDAHVEVDVRHPQRGIKAT